jgi:hypothetical protein
MVVVDKNPGVFLTHVTRGLHTKRAAQVVLILGALAVPGVMWAQFQEPTADELKMTSDPKAPGAAAVYLYKEESNDEEQHTVTYYCRIKVLSEKGKELATVQIPYVHGLDIVTDVQGRTIHADGKKAELTAKPSDLMDVKDKAIQLNTVVFTLPDVDVGSILEYRLKIHYPGFIPAEPKWDLQGPYFIQKGTLQLSSVQYVWSGKQQG